MDEMDMYTIAERYIDLINPISEEKILEVGEVMGLGEGSRVIEFGSGYGEVLALWAEMHGITGVGIELREAVVDRAIKQLADRGLGERIDVVCMDGSKYEYEPAAFDVAACIGASFIWGDFRKTIRGMKDAIKPGGHLAIGEPYWLTSDVPQEYRDKYKEFGTELELWEIAREEEFEFKYVVRSSHDDWDRYEAGNWLGLHAWLDENRGHEDWQQVKDRLHEFQDEYLRYGREFCGWAVYVLKPTWR
jgi:SAM-dependent methyltransferase